MSWTSVNERDSSELATMGEEFKVAKASKKRTGAKAVNSAQVREVDLQVDEKLAVDLVMDLLAIPGKSGQEGAVAEFIKQQLLRAGVPQSAIATDKANSRTPINGETGNLVLTLPGTIRGPRRMLSAHMDTVPICVGCKPVRTKNLVRSADPTTGLGADDRAGVGVILTAALEIVRRGLPHPPLTFCWFIQEEIGLQGARLINKSMLKNPQYAFNWDGGSPCKLTIGATGGYRLDIDVRGIASHAGGAPEWGVSAISIASLAIADLQRNGWHGLIQKGKNLGTSNVGMISGGEATNVVTDYVQLRAEARSHNPKFRQKIVAEIENAFKLAAKEVKSITGATGTAEIRGRLDYEAFKLSENEPCVEIAKTAVNSVGGEVQLAVANGGLDANWLNRHGIPTVSLGCGQMNQHMVTEFLDLDWYKEACRIGLRVATATEQT
ncbi:MAG: tripeptide aminopeptidase [Pirellulaceae bacterium]|jgi:tripeptide aminopeptidase